MEAKSKKEVLHDLIIGALVFLVLSVYRVASPKLEALYSKCLDKYGAWRAKRNAAKSMEATS